MALIDTARHWPVSDRDPVSGWTTPHTALIGHAAQAMLQYLGQGACEALEDALALAAASTHHPRDQDESVRAYEKQRIASASRCQTVAGPWGALWHTQDPVLLALRNRVFRLRSADDYTDPDWLYAEPAA
jgi:3-hydroxybenzoate 6-monooxygenase